MIAVLANFLNNKFVIQSLLEDFLLGGLVVLMILFISLEETKCITLKIIKAIYR